MRMIDADLLECDTEWSEYEDGFTAYSRVQIVCAPSIDIIRCGECKYWNNKTDMTYCDRTVWFGTDADDYCSFGEREGER